MKYDLILAGVGGQGILSIAAVVCSAAVRTGYRIKQSEVHGMAQRGGAVQAHVRMSDRLIYSDLIPLGSADLILGMEPLESLRYVPWLSPEGTIISNTESVRNTATYPADEELTEALSARGKVLRIDASGIAREFRQPRALNMALLGAAAPLLPYSVDVIEQAIRDIFSAKGDRVIDLNLAVFRAGLEKGRAV